jgi:hypothetical protein
MKYPLFGVSDLRIEISNQAFGDSGAGSREACAPITAEAHPFLSPFPKV